MRVKEYIRKFKEDKHLWILSLLIVVAGFLRIYRVDHIMWFFFDQGRDALVIWELITKGKLFLIGPTTGLEGVFLGPFFYYLIAPAYFLGGGDPAWAGGFVGLIGALGLIFVYLLGSQISNLAGLFAVYMMAISYNWIRNDRWLANPAPLSFFAPLTLYILWLCSKKPIRYALFGGLLLGLNLQLEASGSFFTLFAVLIWLIVAKIYKQIKAVGLGFLGFFITLIPQLLFELRHNFLITNNLLDFLHSGSDSGSSFYIPTVYLFNERLKFIYTTYMDKIEPNPSYVGVVVILVALSVIIANRKLLTHKLVVFLLIWTMIPSLIFFFYRGNHGHVFSYYLNPVIPAVFLLLGISLSSLWRNIFGKLVVIMFLIAFTYLQYKFGYGYIMDGLTGYNTIALGNQKQSVDWVYNKASGREFNVDFYVPPVIPYSYRYLFLWYGDKKYGYLPKDELVSELYTIREYDSESKRVESWLKRQEGIGKIVEVATFGGIVAEKRERINFNE